MQKKKRQQRRKYYTIMDEMMASPTEPLPVAHRTHQLTMMYGGLNAMETAPTPTTDDWRVVSDAVNLMETLVVEMKVCEDSDGLLMDAITGLALAGKRNMAGGSIRMDGVGIKSVRAILSDYAELLDVLSARTMIRCHRLTEKRLHELLDGKRRPHDVEITSL
jgi:mRNA-degrading endonuclease YafQ of YafQ-DinJ toxin-antitoxin module